MGLSVTAPLEAAKEFESHHKKMVLYGGLGLGALTLIMLLKRKLSNSNPAATALTAPYSGGPTYNVTIPGVDSSVAPSPTVPINGGAIDPTPPPAPAPAPVPVTPSPTPVPVVAQPPAPAPPPAPRTAYTYTVKGGDTWSQIVQKYYNGGTSAWETLFNVDRSQFARGGYNPHWIFPGEKFTLPTQYGNWSLQTTAGLS